MIVWGECVEEKKSEFRCQTYRGDILILHYEMLIPEYVF